MYVPQHIRRHFGMPHTFVSALCTSILLLAACSTDESPTAPSAPAGTAPSFLIRDAVHSGGLVGFFWLPPIARTIKYVGAFDPDLAGLNPVVTIRVCSGDNCPSVGATVAEFTRTSTPAITYKKTIPQYQVSWSTTGFALGTYRIEVVAGTVGFRRVMGQADVKLTATATAAKSATTTQQIGLKVGSPLDINFRIETRIAGSVTISPTAATISPGGTQQFTATLRDLHGALLGGKTVRWQSASSPATGVIASVTPISGSTNGSGQVVTTVTAGSTPGQATVYAVSSDQASADNLLYATAALTVRAPGWTVVDLGTLGGTAAAANGINNSGQVVGYSYTTGDAATRAFLWEQGTGMQELPNFGGSSASGTGINDNGQVVGSASTPEPNGVSHAFLWKAGVGMTDLGAYGGTSGPGLFSAAFGINGNGQIVGWANPSYSENYHAVLWENGQPMTDLNRAGVIFSGANGINATGQVAGQSSNPDNSANHAVLWDKGTGTWTMTDLGTLGVADYSNARGINSSCQVVGETYATPEELHAFLWEKGSCTGTGTGTMRDLGTLGGAQSYATAINDVGKVVGYSDTGDSTAAGDVKRHAFVWQAGVMTDLGTLPGGNYSEAHSINNQGQVVGSSTASGDAVSHATMWVPPQVP